LHAVGNEESHLHQLISWKGFVSYQKIVQQMKGSLSHALGKQIGPAGRKWFTRGASEKRVSDQEHFDHLVETYFPSHRGLFWKEGQPLP
jgi:hypothetical protein